MARLTVGLVIAAGSLFSLPPGVGPSLAENGGSGTRPTVFVSDEYPPHREPPPLPDEWDRVSWAIGFCESTSGKLSRNFYGIIDRTWKSWGGRRFASVARLATRAEQHEVGRTGFQRHRFRPWNASRGCWSQLL